MHLLTHGNPIFIIMSDSGQLIFDWKKKKTDDDDDDGMRYGGGVDILRYFCRFFCSMRLFV